MMGRGVSQFKKGLDEADSEAEQSGADESQ
jgi:hypothetical protein